MNKVEMISKVVERLEAQEVKVTKKAMTTYVDAIFDTIADSMVTGEDVRIAGFGQFLSVERPERDCRNPQDGSVVHVEAYKSPKFKPSTTLKSLVKGK